jgi:diketogulonate reductase-like aldo/keto reductase
LLIASLLLDAALNVLPGAGLLVPQGAPTYLTWKPRRLAAYVSERSATEGGQHSMPRFPSVERRMLLGSLGAAGAAATLLRPSVGAARQGPLPTRPIPSTGEALPIVGLGSWITFNVGDDPVARGACAEVMRAFFEAGGRLIDSSPMYGSSQAVIGHGIRELGEPPGLFSADKVWTSSGARGPAQIEASRRHWGVPRFDLLQVHNLLSWEEHLRTLFAMKAAGQVRYIGITTSEGRRHREFERIMRGQPLDFVQLTYNILDREAEDRLLPLARDRGIGVIVNRPFRQGALLTQVERDPLPAWAGELGCASWAQFLLKFAVSHPAVTCAIPATTRVEHVRENMGAAHGPLPDEATRRRMVAHVEKL